MTLHRLSSCAWRLELDGIPAGTIEHTTHHGHSYRTNAYTPDGARIGTYLSDGAALAELERRHRVEHPGELVALVLTHPDGSHSLADYPDAVTACHAAGIAVHRNGDAVHGIVIGPTGATVAEYRDRDPRPITTQEQTR